MPWLREQWRRPLRARMQGEFADLCGDNSSPFGRFLGANQNLARFLEAALQLAGEARLGAGAANPGSTNPGSANPGAGTAPGA